MKYLKFTVFAALFMALAAFVYAEDDNLETVSGKLKVVLDDQGSVKSAAVLDEEGEVSYNVVITKDSTTQLKAFNGKMVEISGKVSEKSENEPLQITVVKIAEKAAE